MRSFRRTRGIVVADHDVLGLHAHFVRGDLREHGEDAFPDLSDAGDDLGAAAVVDLGPGAGAIDRRGPRDPVPAASHASSAFAGHRLLRRFLSFRPPQSARPVCRAAGYRSGRDRARAVATRRRRARFPNRRPSPAHRARADQADRTKPAFVCVSAPSRIALMRRISNGSSPSRSAQMSRWDSVANGGLQRAEGTEGARWRVVGVDANRYRPDVGNGVRPRRQYRGLAHDAFGRQAVGAAVADHLHLHRADAAIARQAHPQHGARGVALGRGDDRFLAREHQPYRAAASSSRAGPACPGRSCLPCRRSRRRPGS